MTFMFALTMAVLTATPSPKDAFPKSPQGSPIVPGSELQDPNTCARAGGTWQQIGIFAQACAIPAPDAGKSCIDSSECGGACLVELSRKVPAGAKVSGTCSSHYIVWGCRQLVEHGQAGDALCID